jgi:L-threonylcarbamoyladenylate synthase
VSTVKESAARRHLRAGRVIVHPTEGVFGLACLAFDPHACRRVSVLKRRPANKRFIVVVAHFEQIAHVLDVRQSEFTQLEQKWPNPETWILPASRVAPKWLCSDSNTIAVRVTRHAQFLRLCRSTGPLLSTSANLPNRPPAVSLLQARHYFGATVDSYLSGRLTNMGKPSVIRDIQTGNIVRA